MLSAGDSDDAPDPRMRGKEGDRARNRQSQGRAGQRREVGGKGGREEGGNCESNRLGQINLPNVFHLSFEITQLTLSQNELWERLSQL